MRRSVSLWVSVIMLAIAPVLLSPGPLRAQTDDVVAKIVVEGARPAGKYHEVQSVVNLRGQAPFRVSFMVSDRNRFFDLVIEGISLLKSERVEIGAMLDRYDAACRRDGGSGGATDARLEKIYASLAILADRNAADDRAERLLALFSDPAD